MNEHTTGEELITTAGFISVTLARTMDLKELTALSELIGLVKHQLDIVRFRRFIEEKK